MLAESKDLLLGQFSARDSASDKCKELQAHPTRSLTRDFVLLGFAVSHPFARKKAKGSGTEQVQKQAVRDLNVGF